ncbi:MAG: hypothetical protein ACRDLF_02325 [Solirubrobacteraceae bacterium]
MSEQLKAGIAAAIQVLAEDHGATIEAVTSQAELMALGCVVADASAIERAAPSLDVVGGVLVRLLEEAANSLEEHPDARTVPNRAAAARAALGLYPGTQGKPLRGRRGTPGRLGAVAEWLRYQPDSLFKPRQDGRSPFGALVEDMAEYLVRREIAYLVSEQRRAQQARRPPLESAMRVDWLPRFERYYAMWSYVAGIRYDVELAVAGKRDNNAADFDYFARKSLWYYGCFVRELEDFTRRKGGLWIMPDPTAEQIIADAVWMLRRPTPLTELDESLLRIAVVGWDEMAIFTQATHTDSALRGLADNWSRWIESCDCSNPKRPRKQCTVHLCTSWAASFMDALDQQWDLLADWYDVPRPQSVVNPPKLAR